MKSPLTAINDSARILLNYFTIRTVPWPISVRRGGPRRGGVRAFGRFGGRDWPAERSLRESTPMAGRNTPSHSTAARKPACNMALS